LNWNGTPKVTASELREGMECVDLLIKFFPAISAIVMVGEKAARMYRLPASARKGMQLSRMVTSSRLSIYRRLVVWASRNVGYLPANSIWCAGHKIGQIFSAIRVSFSVRLDETT
jgi:hypothetical protein